MKFKDKIFFIRKNNRFVHKRELIIITLMLVIVVSIFSIVHTIDNYFNHVFFESYDARQYQLFYSEYDDKNIVKEQVLQVKNVKEVFEIYEDHTVLSLIKLGDDEYNGDLFLIGKSDDELRSMANQSDFSKYSLVCPQRLIAKTFSDEGTFINRFSLKRMDKYLFDDASFKLSSVNGDDRILSLKIVALFNNSPMLIDENRCYASRELLKEIYDFESNGEEDGIANLIVTFETNEEEEIIASSQDISKLGYSIYYPYELNYETRDFVKKMAFYIVVVTLVFLIIFIIKFNMDSLSSDVKTYAILKVVGFSDKEYLSLLFINSIFIAVFSFVISMVIILGLVFVFRLVQFYFPFIIVKLPICIDYLAGFIFTLWIIIILLITSCLYMRRIRRRSIAVNLGE